MAATHALRSVMTLALGLAPIALGLGLVHCAAEEEAPKKSSATTAAGGSSVEEARKYFIANVYPTVQSTCAGGCHDKGQKGAPIYLSENGEGSYNAIESTPGYIATPTASPLLQKGLHSGPALTEAQSKTLDAWLVLEANARKLSAGDGRPANLRAGFAAFGACMSYKRWTELKLDTISLTQCDGNAGSCRSCHSAGQSSLWLSENSMETFTKFSQFPYVQKLVVGRVNASGAFDGLENSRRMIDKGTEAQQQQANSHPRFSITSELSGNLTTFVAETLSNMNAKRCENADKPDAGPDAAPAK